MKFRLFLLILFLGSICLGQSGKTIHKVFTKSDGLELDRIQTMAFDNDGFLWLGGENLDIRTIILSEKKLAIQRFDGSGFHSVPLPELEQPITRVEMLYKRKDGKFYLLVHSQDAALLLFDPVTTTFEIIDLNLDPGLSSSNSGIFNYKNSDYILTQRDKNIFVNILQADAGLKQLFSFEMPEVKFLLDSSTLFIPFEDFCIISDDNFPITMIDWEGKILKQYPAEAFLRERGAQIPKLWIDELLEADGNFYPLMHGNPGLHIIDTINRSIELLEIESFKADYKIVDTFNDRKGNNVLLGIEEDGTLSLQEWRVQGFQKLYEKNFLDGPTAVSVMSGNLKDELWLGTNEHELHYFRFPGDQVQNYLLNNSIRALFRLDSEQVIIATEGDGWFVLNTGTNSITPYLLSEEGGPLLPASSRNIIDAGDFLWSNSGGNIIKVNKLTLNTQAYRHYPVICLEQLNDSTLVYGTSGYRLMAFDTFSEQHYALANTDSLFIYDLEVSADQKTIIGGTDKGMMKFDLESRLVKLFGEAEGLADPFILMVDHLPDFGYLLGTRSGQLFSFDIDTGEFELIYSDELNAGIATVLFADNTLWLNTFNGIVAYNPATGGRTRYSTRNGLSDNEANRYSAMEEDTLFFVGTINGLNVFDPSALKLEKNASELLLLNVRKYNADSGNIKSNLNREELGSLESVVLPAEYKELQLDFALTNPSAVDLYRFRYRMNDSEWTDLEQQKSISFPNLAPGNYDLEIEALDFSGNKIGNSLILKIISRDFFYKTWWFYLLVFLITVLLFLYLLKQAQLRSGLQQKFSEDLLLSQETERTRIARELHDSVGQQLTLIKKKAQNVEQAEISSLTHNALEEVRSISRGLHPAVLKQLGLTASIEQLVYDLDSETDLFLSSEIDDIDDLYNEHESLNIYRFVQESLQNIMKHSEAKTVMIYVKKRSETVVLNIADNGKGFNVAEKEKQHSIGLKTLSERIRILGGALSIKSSVGSGTRIIAEIPWKRKNK